MGPTFLWARALGRRSAKKLDATLKGTASGRAWGLSLDSEDFLWDCAWDDELGSAWGHGTEPWWGRTSESGTARVSVLLSATSTVEEWELVMGLGRGERMGKESGPLLGQNLESLWGKRKVLESANGWG